MNIAIQVIFRGIRWKFSLIDWVSRLRYTPAESGHTCKQLGQPQVGKVEDCTLLEVE